MHSQQIPALGTDVCDDNTQTPNIAAGQSLQGESLSHDVGDTTETESISEHIPSRADESASESHNALKSHESQGLPRIEADEENVAANNTVNIPFPHSPHSENPSIQDPSRQSTSWPIDVNALSDMHLISEESPVNLALSSDLSKECGTHENKSPSLKTSPQSSKPGTPQESPREDQYDDSLNEEQSRRDISEVDDKSIEISISSLDKNDSPERPSSGSEEIIKLDIRGQGVPKFPLPTAKIIFGPPPEGSTVIGPNIEPIPVFPNLLSPFLVGAGDNVKVEEVFDFTEQPSKEPSPDKSLELSDKQSSSSDKFEQNDLLVEELTVDYERKEKDDVKQDEQMGTPQPKSLAPEDMSLSTLTTDYKTICEEYHEKVLVVVHGLWFCACLLCSLALLCILILIVTPMACYILMFYQMHIFIYENISKYCLFLLNN